MELVKMAYATSAQRLLEYSDKMADPRWKIRRHGILCRDSYTCRMCGLTHTVATEACLWWWNLQVHHLRYIRGAEPWESPDADLVTLCSDCHFYVECRKRQGKHRPEMNVRFEFNDHGRLVIIADECGGLCSLGEAIDAWAEQYSLQLQG